MAAHVLMPWIHRVFSNLKRWRLGVFHGFRKKFLNAYPGKGKKTVRKFNVGDGRVH